MKRLILTFILIVFVVSTILPAFARSTNIVSGTNKVIVVFNGKKINFKQSPILVKIRALAPAATLFAEIGASYKSSLEKRKAQAKIGNSTIKLIVGKKYFKLNGKKIKSDAAPVIINKTIMMPVRYLCLALGYSLRWDGDSRTVYLSSSRISKISRGGNLKKFVVVVDAGHGGWETGAIHGGVKEKDLNLDIAIKLNEMLKDEGITTYMTRTNDTYIGLYERSGLANRVNADLLISVHNNADEGTRNSGSMSLYYPSSSKSNNNLSSLEFASIVQNELTRSLNANDSGVIPRPHLAVLRTSNMPAVIAEVGYMTNGGELARLKDSAYRTRVAEALKKAVLTALEKI